MTRTPRRATPARLVLGSLLALAGTAVPAHADPGPAGRAPADRLTVTVDGTGDAAYDGRTYTLECGPTGGDHPMAQAACDRLTEAGRPATYAPDAHGAPAAPGAPIGGPRTDDRPEAPEAADLFAPVPSGTLCTMQYGGEATAHVTGTWQGRPVDAVFSRSDGCEIGRWNALQPLLPAPAGV
ncbi:SSI family serine proteinase inhibitor [Streptomyces sp. NPDC060194]|uniref:SSI family serine proteinase inhibitor n=1 Tax=Streptomyces sp. NPDC060194 TaxID=3347069 RepID=UPI0036603F77